MTSHNCLPSTSCEVGVADLLWCVADSSLLTVLPFGCRKVKVKRSKRTRQPASAYPLYSHVQIDYANTQRVSGSQICDVRGRKHTWGCYSWKWNCVIIIIINRCILIIYTLTLSANIARRNELVIAQVI